jgi:peptidoglycan hydrolase-like protein with peptidoglycan-binding domain
MNTKPLLDLIGRIEANGNYNAKFSQTNSQDDLSQYTVSEIQRKQYQWGRNTGSSAFGKYQFLRKTLRGLLDDLDIPDDAKFTPELQDQLAEELLERRGLSRWIAGRLSDDVFLDNLSKEWASLPYRTGRSYYAGDGLNKSLISRNDVRAALHQVRNAKSEIAAPLHPCMNVTLYITQEPVRDRCVEMLQRVLNEWAGGAVPLIVDGVFGPVTRSRVMQFQSKHSLVVDGIIGQKSWDVLAGYVV